MQGLGNQISNTFNKVTGTAPAAAVQSGRDGQNDASSRMRIRFRERLCRCERYALL
ncbi:MAG: hypothetical protein WDN67_05460 [Candidatus Moraniibacteriota bacterium]